jgi:pimeloyl-ACP methyl ester carboxylesterase
MHVPTRAERENRADALASGHGWMPLDIPTRTFDLRAYVPRHGTRSGWLTIYIEGDGFAWFSHSIPSRDPTPIDPLGLKLAMAQPTGEAVYLARPCQYVGATSRHCDVRFWTNRRFGPDVVAAMNQAVQVLKRRFDASRIVLVGYSGGAAVAALVAARRTDVTRLVTVAGNLDPRAWTTYHGVSPLRGSLDPMRVVPDLMHIGIWCLAGENDRDVPPGMVRDYADRFPPGHRPTIIVLRGVDHHDGWVDRWPALWRDIDASVARRQQAPGKP